MKEIVLATPRIPLDAPGLCAHATVEQGLVKFGITDNNQNKMHINVKNPDWGTEPDEIFEMAKMSLKSDHILQKTNWNFKEIKKLISIARVNIILDVTDCLDRIDKIDGKKVEGVDGHYIILETIVNISGLEYGLIIDPSKDEIVQGTSHGIITTNEENVYFIPLSELDLIWQDDKKDGSINNHWALVMLHPDDNSNILDQFRK